MLGRARCRTSGEILLFNFGNLLGFILLFWQRIAMNDKIKPWSAPIDDFEKINKDSVKFIFETAEKRLKHLLEVSDRTTNRAYSFLTTCIPLVAFLLASLFKHYFGNEADNLPCFLLPLLWGAVLICIGSTALLLQVVTPRDMHQIGREPKHIFTKELLLDERYQNENQYKLLLVAETEEFQSRIDFMQSQSNNRVGKVKLALYLLVGCAFIALFDLLLLVLFQ